MTDQVTFNATLEDNVSPNLEKLHKQLLQMGKSPVEIKMILQAVDDATPKIKAAQDHLDKLPKKHTTKWEMTDGQGRPIHTALESIRNSFRTAREEFSKPIRTPFQFVDERGQGIENMGAHLFNLRTRVALPLAGSIPGSNMLYGVGAGAGVAGVATGVAGTFQQSFAINSMMEQQHQMLAQTLKDQQGATKEMNKVVAYAQTTPFQYTDVLKANVIARNYGMPTLPGESKQIPQGYLKLATNMAAMMGTQPEDAMMALAEARQGLPRRLLMYGTHMESKDFGPGGRFQGMSPDQALALAGKRYEGATQSQMKTFAGISSNIKDVVQQQVMKPIGEAIFNAVEKQAFHTADSLTHIDVQQKIGMAVEKVQHLTVEIIQNLAKMHSYFDMHLKAPLEEAITALTKVGRAFTVAFGTGIGATLKTVGDAILSITEPMASLTKSVPIFGTLFGYMKAMQLVGMGGAARPLQTMFNGLNPMAHQNPLTALPRALMQLPGAAVKVGGFLILKDILDAHRATKDLNNEFSNMGGHLDDINAKVSSMAMGLGESGTHVKNLVTAAAQGIPVGRLRPEARANLAEDTARAGILLSRTTGIGASDIVRTLNEQMKENQTYTSAAMHEFGNELTQLSAVAKELGVSFSTAMRVMAEFAPQAGPVGLGGLKGAPALLSLATGLNQYGVTKSQTSSGFYTPDAVLKQMLTGYGTPVASDIAKIGVKNIGNFWDFRQDPGAIKHYSFNSNEYNRQYAGAVSSQARVRGQIGQLAPSAIGPNGVPITPEPWMQNNLGVNYGRFQGKTANQTAENVASAWLKTSQNVALAGKAYGDAQAAAAKLQSQVESLGQAQQVVDLQMQAFQHLITLQQRKVEDASLALQEYTFANLRPLERQLTRIQNVMDIVNHTMSDAQYQMSKYADGLLSGEQAALNQLHALQLYNEQLNYLKMQYTQIGAQLGTNIYERGYSARVKPLMGLSLEMQTQQLQRRQELAQAKYDITYGEGHYQMQQAQRPLWQRTEMPLDTRLKNIKENQGIIDKATIQSHDLGNVQFALQQKMFKVNEHIADQTDKITGLQLAVQKMQQSGTMRGLEDSQFNLAQKVGYANLQITKQQALSSKWQTALTDLRQQAQDLQKLFATLFVFPQGGGPEAFKNASNAVKEAVKTGLIDKKEGKELLGMLNKARTTAAAAHVANTQWYHQKTDVKDVIMQAIIGVFTGDLWRKLGDMVKHLPGIGGPLSTGLHLMGSVAPIATLVATSLAAGGVGIWAMKKIVTKMLPEGLLGIAGRGAEALGGELSRLPMGARGLWMGNLGSALGDLNTPSAIRNKLSGGLLSTIRSRFEPLLHPIANWRGILGRVGGTAAGLALGGGNPIVGALGGLLGGKIGRDTTMREGAAAVKEVAKDLRHPVSAMERAAEHVKEAAAKEGKTAVENAKSAIKNHTSSDRFHGAVDRAKETVHSEGEHVKAFGDHVGGKGFWGGVREFTSEHKGVGKFAGAVSLIAAAAQLFGNNVKDLVKMIGHFFSGNPLTGPASDVRKAAKAASLEGSSASDASRINSLIESHPELKKILQRAKDSGAKAVEVGGKVFRVATKAFGALSFAPAVGDLLGGNVGKAAKDAANAGSYFIPWVGGARLGNDLLKLISGKDAPHWLAAGLGLGGQRGETLNTHTGWANAMLGATPFSGPTAAGVPGMPTTSSANVDIYRVWIKQLETYLSQNKNITKADRDRAQRDLRHALQNETTLQREWHDLTLSQHQEYYTLDIQQQADAQKAALTGPNGLQTYLKSVNNHLNTHWAERVKAIAQGYTNENKTHGAGYKAIATTTGNWLEALTKQIDNWSKKNGLPLTKTTTGQGVASVSAPIAGAVQAIGNVGNLFNGYEAGGVVKADPYKVGPGRLVRMVEEGHPEMVIPLAPHRRDRAKALLSETHALLGGHRAKGAQIYNRAGEVIIHGDLSKMPGRATGGYVWPYGPGITSGRIDEGWDMAGSGPIAAIGDTGPLMPGQSGWPGTGQGFYYQLKSGIRAGQYVYNYENIQRLKPFGYQAKAGEVLANLLPAYPHLEAGWSTSSGAPTSQGRYTEGVPEPEGYDFQRFLQGLAHGKLIGGGTASGVAGQQVSPIDLMKVPEKLRGMGLIAARQYRILLNKRKQWTKQLNTHSTGSAGGTGGVPSLPGGWFRVGATIDPTMGQASYDAHGGFSFAELLEAGTNAGMRPDLTQVLGLPRGGYGMAMETPIWARMPGGQKMFKLWKNDVGSGQPGNSHYKVDLHQAIANALNWTPNQDIEVKKAAQGFRGFVRKPTLFMTGEAGNEHVNIRPESQNPIITEDASRKRQTYPGMGFAKFEETFIKAYKSIQNIENDIHKVEKHLRQDKTPQEKQKDTDILKGLNAQLRARRGQEIGAEKAYERAIATGLRKVHDRSGGEDTLAGVQHEKSIRNKLIQNATNHNKQITRATNQLHRDQRKFAHLNKEVHTKGHHETQKEKHELATLRKKIVNDTHHISTVQKNSLQHAKERYVVGASERGVNAGLMRAITGHGLDKQQTKAYDKLSKAFLNASRTGANTHSKAIQKLEKQLDKTLTVSSKKTVDEHKKTTKYTQNVHKAVAASIPHIKASAAAAQNQVAKITKATDNADKHNAKHTTHMSKTETHQKTLEKKLDALLSKDTVVNITQTVQGASVTTTRQPVRRKAR